MYNTTNYNVAAKRHAIPALLVRNVHLHVHHNTFNRYVAFPKQNIWTHVPFDFKVQFDEANLSLQALEHFFRITDVLPEEKINIFKRTEGRGRGGCVVSHKDARKRKGLTRSVLQ